jgi:hypothetical protein
MTLPKKGRDVALASLWRAGRRRASGHSVDEVIRLLMAKLRAQLVMEG